MMFDQFCMKQFTFTKTLPKSGTKYLQIIAYFTKI